MNEQEKSMMEEMDDAYKTVKKMTDWTQGLMKNEEYYSDIKAIGLSTLICTKIIRSLKA